MQTKEFLIEFFAQGLVKRGGNCASIAIIKSAIGQYDLNVFELKSTTTGYAVTLKNNPAQGKIIFPLTISNEEFSVADSMHGFKQQLAGNAADTYYKYARICYAVMAKTCMLMRGYNKYKSALTDLNRGENTDTIAGFLGLDPLYSPIITKGEEMTRIEFDKKVNATANVLLYSDGHAVFSSEGAFDDHGEQVPYAEENYGFKYMRYPN